MQQKTDSATKKSKMVLVKAENTGNKGDFDFSQLPVTAKLQLNISSTGYAALQQDVSFMPKKAPGSAPTASGAISFEKELGNLKMTVDTKILSTITIQAPAPSLKLDIDKKVFNVEKNIVSAGGTALDVMRNVPSVQVDIDGNVKLRNASPQLYIDGRPTTLTLDQIPADAIQSVEVITNPSAKYDASGGGGGILNIILKKNRKTGYNGNARAGVDGHGGVNGGMNFNLRQDKFNFTAAGFYNQNRGVTNGTTNRENFTDTATAIHESNYDKNKGAFAFGSLGFDYFMTPRTTFSLTGIKVHGAFKPYQLLDIQNNT